jgi:hypothetical protein
MVLNVKLQGLKYNYKKVQGCFCKILWFRRFSGFMELFSLRKIHRICPRYRGPGPPALAHGSMDFIKHQLLVTGSTAQIKPIEQVSQLLISTVHHWSDGWGGWLRPRAAPSHARGGTSRSSAVAHRSLSFLEPGWSVFDEVCSYGITSMRGTCLC